MTDETKDNRTNGDIDNGPAAAAEETAAQAPVSPEAEAATDLEADLRKLQDERNTLFEQMARVQADFRNAQKRLESEKLLAIQFANGKLISTLLPVIDNFERALETDPTKADAAAVLKGLQIVYDQLMGVLKQQHIEAIAPQPGTPFDPNVHQALMQQPDDRYTEPTVTQLLQKGYMLHDRVLRPAQVAVSRTQS
ncbi:MAG TPA: nucleotide exchange factor GrpE [Tepidisphaeraceae bacterium]|nr:nucleotide exchange factor GrpE [Tepidisphaeraceae bacterium]